MSDSTSEFVQEGFPRQDPGSLGASRPLPSVERRLRLWPGIVIIALQWIVVTAIIAIWPGTQIHFMGMFIGPMVGSVAIVAWWLFASRLSWLDRILVPVAFAVYGVATYFLADKSIGMFGILLYGLPTAMTAWIAWLVISYPLPWSIRRIGLLVCLVLAWGYFTLLRMDGVDGSLSATLNWRWSPTAEQVFLAERSASSLPRNDGTAEKSNTVALKLEPGDWPGFRGARLDNRIVGVKIPTNWNTQPPNLLWRHKVGPGWSSFVVIGNHLYTQEQWDKKEAVVCYDASTGKLLWFREDEARFEETVAGPGPRATPAFHEGKLYTLGAAGKLNCLDAATGKELWSQNVLDARDKGDDKVPTWGFASSPLVEHGKVFVFVGGKNGKSAAAYDAVTGKFAWASGIGEMSYCSLQGAKIDGVEQVLLATGEGLTAYQPNDGKVLWEYKWLLEGGARVVQPAQVGDSDFLIGTGFGNGTRRIHVSHKDEKWDVKVVWTTRAINPYFNDFVVHRDHMFGFDGKFFACVSVDQGKLKWKERGYGSGQVLLLADQDLLLVISEQGEAALVEANASEFKEIGRFQAIQGKTWNHPVLAHGKLFVRNGEEAACYQLVGDNNDR